MSDERDRRLAAELLFMESGGDPGAEDRLLVAALGRAGRTRDLVAEVTWNTRWREQAEVERDAATERAALIAESMCHWRQGCGDGPESHREFHFGNTCPYEAVAAVLRGEPDPRETAAELDDEPDCDVSFCPLILGHLGPHQRRNDEARCEHDWDFMQAYSTCRTCGAKWTRQGEACPGPPAAPGTEPMDCERCSGTGEYYDRPCGTCSGLGYVAPRTDTEDVR